MIVVMIIVEDLRGCTCLTGLPRDLLSQQAEIDGDEDDEDE